MLYIDGINLRFLVKELHEKLKGKKVSRIIQYDNLSFSLFFGKDNLYFSINPSLPLIYLKENKELAPEKPLNFSLSLKKFLLSAQIEKIEQLDYDRIVIMSFSKIDELGDFKEYRLIIELTGKHSNIFILDKENKILDLAKKFSLEESSLRLLMPHAPYEEPKVDDKVLYNTVDEETFNRIKGNLSREVQGFGKFNNEKCTDYNIFSNILNEAVTPTIYYENNKIIFASFLTYDKFAHLESETFESCNELINYYTEKTLSNNFISALKKELDKGLHSRIKKHEKILGNLKKDQNEMDKYDRLKEIGDILAANLYAIKPRSKMVEAYDFYKNINIFIDLDEKRTPQQNLDSYYKRYNKGKRGVVHAIEREKLISEELRYFNELLFFLDKAENVEVLKDLKEEFMQNGILPKKQIKGKLKKVIINPPFEIIEDSRVYYGRNNKENEYITFKLADGDDLWFHIKDLPGSHVIIKTNLEVTTESLILETAKLCAANSKVSKGNRVRIDYCKKKFVKKPKGSAVGNVIYSNEKSIFIDI